MSSKQMGWAIEQAIEQGHDVDVNDVTVDGTVERVVCHRCGQSITFDHGTMDAHGHETPCTVDETGTGIDAIASRLIALRKRTEALSMEKAKLLKAVKDGKLYRDRFGDFESFCEHVGYHRGTVYKLIACFEHEQVRSRYTDLGALNANRIVTATNKLAKHMDNPAPVIDDLIDYAADHTTGETKARIDQVIEDVKQSATDDDDDETEDDNEASLAGLLARKTKLLNEKSDLMARLSQIEQQLSQIEQQIEDASS